MGLRNKRPRRLNYAVNQKRIKSTSKVGNAVKHFEILKKRVAKEGETKWLSNAFLIVEKKLRKYGIKTNK
ncbi:MAG: hypothetical protein NWP80_01820 [Candidatus Gracilibacteria bacterium]|nr:hypothetical protein [Candidatus Gracilibacteria bacterium]